MKRPAAIEVVGSFDLSDSDHEEPPQVKPFESEHKKDKSKSPVKKRFASPRNACRFTINLDEQEEEKENKRLTKKIAELTSDPDLTLPVIQKPSTPQSNSANKNSLVKSISQQNVLKKFRAQSNSRGLAHAITQEGLLPPIRAKSGAQQVVTDLVDKFSYATRAGMNAKQERKTNQDNFFVVKNFSRVKNMWYFGVCDGHGQNGHQISKFVKSNLANVTMKTEDKIQNEYSLEIARKRVLGDHVYRDHEPTHREQIEITKEKNELVRMQKSYLLDHGHEATFTRDKIFKDAFV